MIYCIAAISKNKQIGLNNQLPWHIPEDLKHFKRLTTGKTVIMGRKTYESIGKPLPNRHNVILTHQKDFKVDPSVTVLHSLDEALSLCHQLNDVFVIGGGQLYKAFLPYADKLYLTLVDLIIKGDTAFPSFEQDFTCIETTLGQPKDPESPRYTFTVWTRR